ncbi:MAG: tRNA (adenosine(37)-N6)-threonylcarbamoyltransferase complex dimerization subunit type 1 TsaB [Crocinitomicaceae bacterium]|nr:tRNA (adenosine(37)-N6)-threonylcarbamoyltransferase complex dimerization subunit type 1 TsaB [Crocinitomicaceae bacterium]
MALILNLETATKTCSVALAQDSEIVAVEEFTSEKFSHAEKLNLFIQKVLESANFSMKDLDAVAVSAGPGSYTGLRIGASTAKGICYALDIPLISINSLKALANMAETGDSLICPMFDARRMEVYAAVYDSDLNTIQSTNAVVVDDESFADFLKEKQVIFMGPGAEKCKEVLKADNAIFDLSTPVSAKGMASLSYEKFKANEFEDVAYFEPAYLKDFVAGKPKKLI